MKLLSGAGCRFPASGGNEGFPEISDYDSRRTGNRSLDAGSTPAYSTYEVARRTPEATVIVVRFGIVLACKLQI